MTERVNEKDEAASGEPIQMVAASANTWRDRALRAEAEVERLRAALEEIGNGRDWVMPPGGNWHRQAFNRAVDIAHYVLSADEDAATAEAFSVTLADGLSGEASDDA